MSGTTHLNQDAIRSVVEEVLAKLGSPTTTAPASTPAPSAPAEKPCACHQSSSSTDGKYGVFEDADAAAKAAADAFAQLKEKGYEGRQKVIDIVKSLCLANANEWGRIEFEETKIGRLDHKVEKLQIVKNVPGVEWLKPYALSGDGGITLEEYAPFGVVCGILPVTHSVPTMSGNIVNMVAAGNTTVFNPHPGGAACAAIAVEAYNRAIEAELGISNIICTVRKPTLESFNALCQSEYVDLLAVTGGPAVVKAAMASGKRAICAGPGNPPVVVDATANLKKAACDVIAGAAYDNNLLCIGEKAVFVVAEVFDAFMKELEACGAVGMSSSQLEKLTPEVFTFKDDGGGCSHPVLNRELVGKDPSVMAQRAGFSVGEKTPLLIAETAADNPFVIEEQMMPVLPIVRVNSVCEAIDGAVKAEHGYKHSAIIHSLNVDHMTAMARRIDTTVFVKNGPCTAGLGLGGEGYLSYSIATTTGEGITTPKTFTRTRRCVLVENLNIIG